MLLWVHPRNANRRVYHLESTLSPGNISRSRPTVCAYVVEVHVCSHIKELTIEHDIPWCANKHEECLPSPRQLTWLRGIERHHQFNSNCGQENSRNSSVFNFYTDHQVYLLYQCSVTKWPVRFEHFHPGQTLSMLTRESRTGMSLVEPIALLLAFSPIVRTRFMTSDSQNPRRECSSGLLSDRIFHFDLPTLQRGIWKNEAIDKIQKLLRSSYFCNESFSFEKVVFFLSWSKFIFSRQIARVITRLMSFSRRNSRLRF